MDVRGGMWCSLVSLKERILMIEWGTVADWAVAIATLLLAFVAVFQDKIRAHVKSPILDCDIELKPPDCHKTTMTGGGLAFSSFYYLLKIWNKGETSARNVEVIISDIFKKEGENYKSIEGFIPDNLLWSIITETLGVDKEGRPIIKLKVYCSFISPKTFKHCNIGHIYDPKYRKSVQGEDNPGLPVNPEETIFHFDVNFKSNKRYYLVSPGTYKFKITVGCENAKTISKMYLMEVSGKWYEDESRMLNEGLFIKEIN